jgi:exodeoxyribonuclease V beta subunit
MEFVYPLPERGLPGLAAEVDVLRQIDAGGVRLDAGFVRGFVDYLFVHEGLAYFVDWKGNVLPRYDGPALAAYVAESYRYQERLYALALLKLLRVRSAADHEARFGGFLYCFLRGMLPGAPAAPAGAPGVYFHRPAWPTILAWEAELAAYGDAVAGRDPEGAP